MQQHRSRVPITARLRPGSAASAQDAKRRFVAIALVRVERAPNVKAITTHTRPFTFAEKVTTSSPKRVGWLSEYSEASLRPALRVAAPDLTNLPICGDANQDFSNPLYQGHTT
jgi:hypothetical protein